MNRVLIILLVVYFECAILYSKEFETKLKKPGNFSTHKDISSNDNIKLLNTTFAKNFFSTTPKVQLNKKWQIERVTKRHYEIFNLLWQKTKIFIDVDYSDLTCKATTTELKPEIVKTSKTSTLRTPEQQKLQTSTPSYIEFYYLDQSDDRIKRKYPQDLFLAKLRNSTNSYIDPSNIRKDSIPSLFKIRVDTVPRKYPPMGSQLIKSVHKINPINIDSNYIRESKIRNFGNDVSSTINIKPKLKSSKQIKKSKVEQSTNSLHTSAVNKIINRSGAKTSKNHLSFNLHPGASINDTYLNENELTPITVTVYDKVRFFEIYDSNTPPWQDYIQTNVSNVIYDNVNKPRFGHEEILLLRNGNSDTGPHNEKNKTRHVKKDIQNLNGKKERSENENFRRHVLKNSSKTAESLPFQKHSNGSRLAAWSEFPFVAVYIYEPSQVHCDAASISPHWLLAAASCLSRHHKELRGGSLSAFVTYCSDNWRHPYRISYVKRTLVHPGYHPRDKARHHQFNAGVIQVVNSMADTCSGWAPVSLMSHRFTADQKGSIAAAVGWGLDRYDKRYINKNIPKHPLMSYEGLMYSESCPGNLEYSNAKRSDEDEISNVYCLSLPPYLAEENDTVHGALLLIGGKLLALYLEEERRPWGAQSAQYTGVWRMLPWLADTAREPDDLYAFQFEI